MEHAHWAVPAHGQGKRWRARYVDNDGREVARGFTRKVDAQKWLDEVTSTIVAGSYVAPGAGTATVGQMHERLTTCGHVKDDEGRASLVLGGTRARRLGD